MTISPHPPQARIPVELFREVISHIDDTSVLATVALVCHTLLYEARRQLYTSLAPRDTLNILQHLHLLRTLVEWPALASLVTSFHSSEVIQVYEAPLWELLQSALRQMPNLKRLHFRSFGGTPCGDLLIDCPFQLEYLHWGNHSEDMGVDGNLFTALSQQRGLRYLHLQCEVFEPLPPEICPHLQVLEGNFASFETFLPGRDITAVSWIPGLRESTLIQSKLPDLASELQRVRVLTFGGYFSRPHLGDIIEYIHAVEYLELVGYTPGELELLPRLVNLRRLALTLGRPSSSALSSSQSTSTSRSFIITVSSRFTVMQRLFQECHSLERIDLMQDGSVTPWGKRGGKLADEVCYEKFELSSPGSSVFMTAIERHISQFID